MKPAIENFSIREGEGEDALTDAGADPGEGEDVALIHAGEGVVLAVIAYADAGVDTVRFQGLNNTPTSSSPGSKPSALMRTPIAVKRRAPMRRYADVSATVKAQIATVLKSRRMY